MPQTRYSKLFNRKYERHVEAIVPLIRASRVLSASDVLACERAVQQAEKVIQVEDDSQASQSSIVIPETPLTLKRTRHRRHSAGMPTTAAELPILETPGSISPERNRRRRARLAPSQSQALDLENSVAQPQTPVANDCSQQQCSTPRSFVFATPHPTRRASANTAARSALKQVATVSALNITSGAVTPASAVAPSFCIPETPTSVMFTTPVRRSQRGCQKLLSATQAPPSAERYRTPVGMWATQHSPVVLSDVEWQHTRRQLRHELAKVAQ